MNTEALATELLQFMETLPRRASQHWLGDFSRGELFLLNYLQMNGNTACPSEMSDAMQTSTARIAAALNGLERKGWIKRVAVDDDRRRKLVHLTALGIEHIESYRKKALENITLLLTELGEEDAAAYVRILRRMETISRGLEPEM